MNKKQYYGIKYPFTALSPQNYFLDVNENIYDKVKGLLMHVIFTPKGQKVRDPNFGTNLIKYLFEPNESSTWEAIKNEISEVVKTYVNGVTINDIIILTDEEDSNAIFVQINYSISSGIKIIEDSLIVKI